MKRWNVKAKKDVENEKIDAFLAEIIEVSKKHGLSLSHEDQHGSFEVVQYNNAYSKWLLDALDKT